VQCKQLMIKQNDFNLLEMLTGLFTPFSKVLVDEDNARREDTEESSKSEHNKVSNTFRERRLASEHGLLPLVPVEGGELEVDTREYHDAIASLKSSSNAFTSCSSAKE
jgi:hypothetical protein